MIVGTCQIKDATTLHFLQITKDKITFIPLKYKKNVQGVAAFNCKVCKNHILTVFEDGSS